MNNSKDKARVVVAMSGGVDSSVAAALLQEQGYQVTGVAMKIWDGETYPVKETRHACYGPDEEEDIEDARRVARILGIDFHVFDLRQEYKQEVLDYFYNEYLAGRTPNPCLRCNRSVKFDSLLQKARDSRIEFDYFASGHYARVEYSKRKHRYLLRKAKDLSKDQSYFLSFLFQEQLSHALFPLGHYSKGEARKISSDLGLGVEDKPDSQNFISGGYSSLVGVAQSGPILNKQGTVLGEHRGIPFYTIGQRRGLGISAKKPLYVTDIDPEKNAIIVGGKEEAYQDELVASGMNWIAVEELQRATKVRARIRYLHDEAEATVKPLNGDRVHVKFQEPQMAITPGQVVVFYDGDIVIGAGTIEKTVE